MAEGVQRVGKLRDTHLGTRAPPICSRRSPSTIAGSLLAAHDKTIYRLVHDPVTTPSRAPAEPGSPETRRSGATVVDVAREAGVSVAVVSRVLNRDPALRVRDATRTRVHAVAEQLSYTPNTSARALRLASSGAICFVVNDLANPIHAAAIEGAQSSAERSGRVMLLTDADELSAHPERLQGMLDSRRVDGLVMHLPGDPRRPGAAQDRTGARPHRRDEFACPWTGRVGDSRRRGLEPASDRASAGARAHRDRRHHGARHLGSFAASPPGRRTRTWRPRIGACSRMGDRGGFQRGPRRSLQAPGCWR